MLVELAIADAYGAGFEYNSEPIAQYNNLQQYIRHGTHGIPKGNYTDDTQMTLAIAEAIVEDDPWTRESLAQRFVDVFKRDERTGYAGRFYEFLVEVQDGPEFLRKIRPDSDKSGGAMRATPIGLFDNHNDVIKRCTLQCKLTHDTPLGIAASNAAAMLTHYCAYGLGAIMDVGDYLNTYAPCPNVDWRSDYVGKVKAQGWMSVQAAVTAFRRNNELSDLLIDCINFTGDVDTVATIAVAAASMHRDYGYSLPQVLWDGLEAAPGQKPAKYGLDYLRKLDIKLLQKFNL